MKPVHPESNKAKQELEKVQDICSELRKQNKDLKQKYFKLCNNAGGKDILNDAKGLTDSKDDDNQLNVAFEKLYQNDKVILSIDKLFKQKVDELDIKRGELRDINQKFEKDHENI